MKRLLTLGLPVCASVALLLYLGLSWFSRDEGSSRAAVRGSNEETASSRIAGEGRSIRGVAGTAADKRAVDEASKAGRTELVAELAVELVDTEGQLLEGSILWQTTEAGLPTGWDWETAVRDAGTRRVDAPDGRARLVVPSGQALWIQARARSEGKPALGCFQSVAPFSGKQSFKLVFSRKAKRLHLFVLENNLQRPAAGAKLRILRNALKTMGTPQPYRELETDAKGYALLDGLESGAYSILTPGATARSRPPRTARLILPESMPYLETTMVLVNEEPSYRLRLEVEAFYPNPAGEPAMLYLRRLGERAGETYPVPGALGGKKEIVKKIYEVRVPAGRYRIGMHPEGAASISEPEIEVRADTSHQLNLVEKQDQVEVQLVGLKRRDLPVTVFPLGTPATEELEPGLAYVGSYRWRESRSKIGRLEQAVPLGVMGRIDCWITKQKLTPDAARASLSLQQATRLEIRWKRKPGLAPSRARVEWSGTGETRIATLLPRLIVDTQGMTPMRKAFLFVPRGKGKIRILDAEGKPVFDKQVEAKEAFQVLTLESGG